MRSTITSTIGDVRTKEVGAVTGALEVATRTGAQDIEVAVRYFGADERYTVEGSPISGRTEPAARYQPSSTRCTGESCAG